MLIELPTELLIEIFSYISRRSDVFSLLCVCKTISKLILEDEQIDKMMWFHIFQENCSLEEKTEEKVQLKKVSMNQTKSNKTLISRRVSYSTTPSTPVNGNENPTPIHNEEWFFSSDSKHTTWKEKSILQPFLF